MSTGPEYVTRAVVFTLDPSPVQERMLRNYLGAARSASHAARLVMRQIERINEEIVTLNFGLVRNYVSRFTRASRDGLEDFESAGVVGLMQAIDSYDPAMGPFGQWAFRPSKRSVLRAVRDVEHSNMSPGDFEKRPDLLRARTYLTVDGGTEPTFEDIARQAGTTVDQARRVLAAPTMVSTSLPVGERGDSNIGDSLADPETYGLPVLNAREMFVMCRRFGIDGEPEAKLSAIGAVTFRFVRTAPSDSLPRRRSSFEHRRQRCQPCEPASPAASLGSDREWAQRSPEC